MIGVIEILGCLSLGGLMTLIFGCHVRSAIYALFRWPAYTCAQCGGHDPVEWILGRECFACTYDPSYRPW